MGFVTWAARARADALPGAGRGDHRDRLGRARHPVDAHRDGQVPRRRRRARRCPRTRRPHVLHGADQGAREREVLRARRHLRRRQRRHGHGRLVGQPRCADRVLHGRDPREPGAAPGRRRAGRPGRHGRVPLLRRPRARVGVAGAAAAPAARAVHADVGDARRRDARSPTTSARRTGRPVARSHRCRAARAAALLVRANARARDGRRRCCRRARRPSTSCTSRRRPRWSGRRRCRASGSSAASSATRSPRRSAASASRPPSARRSRATCGRASACTTRACSRAIAGSSRRSRSAGCSASSAAPTPSGSASTSRFGRCCSRRSRSTTDSGCGSSRAREFHQIAGRAGRAGYDTAGNVVVMAPEHEIENTAAVAQSRGRPQEAQEDRAQEGAAGLRELGRGSFERLVDAEPEPLVPQHAAHRGDAHQRHRPGRRCVRERPRAASPTTTSRPRGSRARAPRARDLPHALVAAGASTCRCRDRRQSALDRRPAAQLRAQPAAVAFRARRDRAARPRRRLSARRDETGPISRGRRHRPLRARRRERHRGHARRPAAVLIQQEFFAPEARRSRP